MNIKVNSGLKKQPLLFGVRSSNMVMLFLMLPIMIGLGALLALLKIVSMMTIIIVAVIFSCTAYIVMRSAEKRIDSTHFEKMLTYYFKQPLKITRYSDEK